MILILILILTKFGAVQLREAVVAAAVSIADNISNVWPSPKTLSQHENQYCCSHEHLVTKAARVTSHLNDLEGPNRRHVQP